MLHFAQNQDVKPEGGWSEMRCFFFGCKPCLSTEERREREGDRERERDSAHEGDIFIFTVDGSIVAGTGVPLGCLWILLHVILI